MAELNTFGVDLETAIEAKFATLINDPDYNFNKSIQALAYLDKNIQNSTNFSLGGVPPLHGKIESWIESVTNAPMPIKYKIYDITDLFFLIITNQSNFDANSARNQFYSYIGRYCS